MARQTARTRLWLAAVALLAVAAEVRGARQAPRHHYGGDVSPHGPAAAAAHDELNRLERWSERLGPVHYHGGRGHSDDNISLHLNTTELHHNGEWVRVYWEQERQSLASRPVVGDDDGDYLALFASRPTPEDALAFAEESSLSSGDPFVVEVVPVKYRKLTSEDWARGYLDARVLLMGSDAQYFAYVARRKGKTQVLALSEGVRFSDYDEAVGVHTAVGRKRQDLVVQWTTFSRASDYKPVVVVYDADSDESFGAAARALNGGDGMAFAGETATYWQSDLCGAPANKEGWVDPGLIHTAYIPGTGNLMAGQRYKYYVGSNTTASASASASGHGGRGGGEWGASLRGPFYFSAAPSAAEDDNSVVSLFAIADMGEFPDDGWSDMDEEVSTQPALVVSRMMIDEYRQGVANSDGWLLLHNGDISYARGFGAIWHAFFDMVEPLAASMPYMTSIGNHERDFPHSGDRYGGTDSQGECGVPYMMRTPMPRQEAERGGEERRRETSSSAEMSSERPSSGRPGGDKPWYAFDFGPIHFLQMSTEHAFEEGSDQHTFIEDDLSRVDRRVTPFVVVGMHRPMYIDSTFDDPSVNSSDQGVARDLRASLEPLFFEKGVDMTWAGHHHSYQRTCSVYQSRCLKPEAKTGANVAPVHVVMGHAGAGLCTNIESKRPPFFESVQVEHGYTRVQATRDFMELTSVNLQGKVIDKVVIVPKH